MRTKAHLPAVPPAGLDIMFITHAGDILEKRRLNGTRILHCPVMEMEENPAPISRNPNIPQGNLGFDSNSPGGKNSAFGKPMYLCVHISLVLS